MSCKNIVSKETISRLVKDITYIRKNPLNENGIYYIHDEDDMLKGYALIIGPEDTPYYGGFYLFEFIYPYNYPFSPPTVNYLTNDGEIRFNPNLYKNGKVCVSILNTWSGDQWSACQTLNSVLLTLCSLLNNNPLTNEPGITPGHPDCEKYKNILKFANISVAMCGMINKKYLPKTFEIFYQIMKESFIKNYDKILLIIDENIEKKEIVFIQLYHCRLSINYEILKQEFIKCKQLIEDNK
jgi:ubiquitin-conjugating enzyme E2 Z